MRYLVFVFFMSLIPSNSFGYENKQDILELKRCSSTLECNDIIKNEKNY